MAHQWDCLLEWLVIARGEWTYCCLVSALRKREGVVRTTGEITVQVRFCHPTSHRIWVAFFALINSGVSSSIVRPLPLTPSSRSLLYSFYKAEKNRNTADTYTTQTHAVLGVVWSDRSKSPKICSAFIKTIKWIKNTGAHTTLIY